jgi:hypothetical protein
MWKKATVGKRDLQIKLLHVVAWIVPIEPASNSSLSGTGANPLLIVRVKQAVKLCVGEGP